MASFSPVSCLALEQALTTNSRSRHFHLHGSQEPTPSDAAPFICETIQRCFPYMNSLKKVQYDIASYPGLKTPLETLMPSLDVAIVSGHDATFNFGLNLPKVGLCLCCGIQVTGLVPKSTSSALRKIMRHIKLEKETFLSLANLRFLEALNLRDNAAQPDDVVVGLLQRRHSILKIKGAEGSRVEPLLQCNKKFLAYNRSGSPKAVMPALLAAVQAKPSIVNLYRAERVRDARPTQQHA